MRVEISEQEFVAARHRWATAGALKRALITSFGTRFSPTRAYNGVTTIYVWLGAVYARRETISPQQDPMPPFKPDYVEGGRRK